MRRGIIPLLMVVSAVVFVGVAVAARPEATPRPFDSPIELEHETIITGGVTILCMVVNQTGQLVLECKNETDRGPLYYYLVTYTIATLNPLAQWGSATCACGLSDARAKGDAIGSVLGMGIAIIGRVFGLIVEVMQSAVGLLAQVLGLVFGVATLPAINCDAEMELFCFGLAGVMSLDDLAGGTLTIVSLFVVALMLIYLAKHAIHEVREMLQPTGSDE